MKPSPDVMIVVGALAVAAFLAAQDTRHEWTLSPSSAPGMVRFHWERYRPGSRSSSTGDVPASDFQGLNMGASGAVKFEYVQDAGSLICTGRFLMGRGSGTFQIQPNPHYVTRLIDLGYAPPTNDQLEEMLFAPVSLEFARIVRDSGLRATTRQLLDLRYQGVSADYLRDIQAAAPAPLTAREVIDLKIQGVTPAFLRELKQAGYDIPVSRVIELKIQGVSPSYIRDLDTYGLKPSARDIVQFKIQGVTPEFLRDIKELGFEFTPREVIDLKIQGVDGRYLRNLRASGIRNLTAQQIVKLKIHGVE
jgi:hypothetical protein